MTLSTYAELTSAIADWLDRGDLTVRIPDFVALAEAQMNRVLRVRQMIVTASATLETASTATPADLLDAIALTLADGTALAAAAPQHLSEAPDAPGRPRRYALVGGALQVHPPPDRAYEVRLRFFARIPPLGPSAQGNWLLTEAPDAYLYGALLQSAPYLRDPEAVALWSAGFDAALSGLRSAQRTQAGPLTVEAGLLEPRLISSIHDGAQP
jgi:hypothetical protein